MANKYVTEEVRKQIGTRGQSRVVEIERDAIRRFAEAIGDPNPLFNDEVAARKTRFGGMIAPPTFCRSLGTSIPEIARNISNLRVLDGGSKWEYFEPIRPGDRISIVSTIANIREIPSRLGPMVSLEVETSYSNQFDTICAVQRSNTFRY
jgi:acyl dehydratase